MTSALRLLTVLLMLASLPGPPDPWLPVDGARCPDCGSVATTRAPDWRLQAALPEPVALAAVDPRDVVLSRADAAALATPGPRLGRTARLVLRPPRGAVATPALAARPPAAPRGPPTSLSAL